MSTPDLRHVRCRMVGDVVLVEVITDFLRTPELAQELGVELTVVSGQEWARRMLVDFRHARYLGSTVFAVLYKFVSQANAAGRQVKFCGMVPEVRIGADIVGLGKFVEIHVDEASGLRAFSQG